MKVNITNYEVWMIDYFDGKLDAVETAELMAFVEENPDIKKEFETFENIGIDGNPANFNSKDQLRKDPIVSTENLNENNYENYFVAYHEGDLTHNQRKEVIEFIAANPVLESEFTFHKELLAKADLSIIYEDKSSLKRKPLIGIYWQVSAVAAAILILFGIFTILNTENDGTLDRNQSLILLTSKTAPVILQQNPVPDLIEKKIIFAEIHVIEEELFYDDYLTLTQISPQFPDISIIDSEEYISLVEKQVFTYDMSNTLAIADEPKRKNVVGRIIQNMARKITGNLPEQKKEEINNDPTFVKALGTGITVFNTITGGGTELVKSYDQNGNLTGYYVEGETIGWRREIAPKSE